MPSFRAFIIPAIIWASSTASHAASLELKLSPSRSPLTRDFPCRVDKQTTVEPTARWRAQLSRRSAVYFVQRLEKACHILAERRDKDPPLAPEVIEILSDISNLGLRPIYRSYPDLEAVGVSEWQTGNVFRAKPKDIRRNTALRLIKELKRLRPQISKLGTKSADQATDKSEAAKALQPFLDAAAELSFAYQIAYDAYPDLFEKSFENIPTQPPSDKSDAAFRKAAPPLGSVRLSDAALCFVKSVMQQVRRLTKEDDQIAFISWVTGAKRKGPADADWIDEGPHWGLGSYSRTQVPPDVIDKVGGIEIIFGTQDPSMLQGKIIDLKDKKLVVHD
jgi:hypothetical protein